MRYKANARCLFYIVVRNGSIHFNDKLLNVQDTRKSTVDYLGVYRTRLDTAEDETVKRRDFKEEPGMVKTKFSRYLEVNLERRRRRLLTMYRYHVTPARVHSFQHTTYPSFCLPSLILSLYEMLSILRKARLKDKELRVLLLCEDYQCSLSN
jgi:hypothetical protein